MLVTVLSCFENFRSLQALYRCCAFGFFSRVSTGFSIWAVYSHYFHFFFVFFSFINGLCKKWKWVRALHSSTWRSIRLPTTWNFFPWTSKALNVFHNWRQTPRYGLSAIKPQSPYCSTKSAHSTSTFLEHSHFRSIFITVQFISHYWNVRNLFSRWIEKGVNKQLFATSTFILDAYGLRLAMK